MYQRLTIIGNLGRDPEMRYLPDGTAVTNFSVATSRRWNDRQTGERQEETTWFRISTWGRQAELANEYLAKGRRVLIEGRLQADPDSGSPRLWTRQDGTVAASFEVRALNMQFLGGPAENGNRDADGVAAEVSSEEIAEADEIPF
jgi:single-strand DNA-binding protein